MRKPVSEILPRPMTIDEFTPLVGQDFEVDCTPDTATIRLIEASPLRDLGISGRPPFILVFHSAPEVMLIDGLYTMRCGSFGPAAIGIGSMVAPIGGAPGHYYYQSIFN
jgi:hypothetical protein